MKKIIYRIFSMPLAGITTLALAIAIAVATFIENDFGTATAQKLIYKAWWFEFLLALFAIILLVNMFRHNVFRWKKLPVLIFHLAGIGVILGAGITRYISFEGLMPIREGKSNNTILSDNTYLQFQLAKENEVTKADFKVLFGSLGNNSFHKRIHLNNGESVDIRLKEFFPNAAEKLEENAEDGAKILSLVHGSNRGRQTVFLKEGEIKQIGMLKFGFDVEQPVDVLIQSKGDSLNYLCPLPVEIMSMMTQTLDTMETAEPVPFQQQHLYNFGGATSIVISKYLPKAKIVPFAKSRKVEPNAYNALVLEIESGNETREMILYGNKGIIGETKQVNMAGINLEASYGSRSIPLPFAIALRDFQLERYPGSNSASSYASEVTLIDGQRSLQKDYRIYMNNVLNYRGYRFFQSSYDPDELGTILSVNHDAWGTRITYFSYFLLALGMFLTIFSPNSRLRKLSRQITKYHEQRISLPLVIFLLLTAGIAANAQTGSGTDARTIPEAHAEKFGKLLIQDMMGRTKPMNTLSSEMVRKLTGRDVFEGQNSDQVLLGMIAYPEQWGKTPLIKVSHPDLRQILGVDERASYEDFFEVNGYKLSQQVEEANRITSASRSKFHKDVLKVDERVNILYMIYNGAFLKMYPREGDTNRKWYTPMEAAGMDFGEEANLLVHNFLPWYLQNIEKGFQTGNWEDADFSVTGLITYQQAYGADVIPSSSRIQAELLYNRLDVFSRLISWYGLVGFVLLILLLVRLFRPSLPLKWPVWIGIGLVILGFLYHSFGLALRWYISGHAPWSNGYESVIYIAWATVLAGLIFSRKSPITLGATSILAAWILIVSMMSWADPQITNLVPVLKSYWLTIHVSIITSSYGFLAIGAILAFLNLLLMILRSKKTEISRLTLTIKELTSVVESTLIIGLFLLSIGTFLGGIWANESWGRYWGWDAKETWSLVSILVYTFIVHMRFIPGLRTVFAFNLMGFVGFAAILMTYFGVNFYLSGLHSYATGDPVPIPDAVYITLMVTVVIATLAYFRQNPEEKIH